MEALNDIRERYAPQIKEKTEQAKAAMSEAAEQARLKSGEYWEATVDFVKENPGASVGIAFVVGITLGALLNSGSSKEDPIEKAAERASEGISNVKESVADSLDHLSGYIDDAAKKLRA